MSFDGNLKAFPSVREHYDAMVVAGDVEADPAQLELTVRYDRLIEEICTKRLSRKSSALGWLFGKRKEATSVIKGLYVHGEVGRGKTMLMDMFFSLLPVERKRRAHFNDFMADVHERIYAHRQALKRGETKQDDPIPPVADALSQQAWVLCFDEFTVTDIADAMILSRRTEPAAFPALHRYSQAACRCDQSRFAHRLPPRKARPPAGLSVTAGF